MPLNGEYEPSQNDRTREQVELYEATNGVKGSTLNGKPVIVLTFKGAKSGKIRKTPLMRIEHHGTQTRGLVPEAFNSQRRILKLIGRRWQEPGYERPYKTANDGTMLSALPFISYEIARDAVQFAATEQLEWARVDLDERRYRVQQCLEEMKLDREI